MRAVTFKRQKIIIKNITYKKPFKNTTNRLLWGGVTKGTIPRFFNKLPKILNDITWIGIVMLFYKIFNVKYSKNLIHDL